MNLRPLALVTGASSGIGAELSVELALKGHDLLLTGRDAVRLEEVAARVRAAGGAAEVKTLDLGQPTAVAALTSWVGARPLAVLVNNAGFGNASRVSKADGSVLSSMIALNVTALTLITHAFLPGMVTRGTGRILNVGSTGSFSPVPTMAVYGATKAFVLSFGDALAEELEGTGVTLTTLCPGATTTGFQSAANLDMSRLQRKAMTAEQVAREGVAALFQGKKVKITGMKNIVMAQSVRFVPRALVARIAGKMMAQD